MIWPFKKRVPVPETRASGFTAEVIQMREAYVSGARGVAELTATVQACASLWEAGLSLADIEGTDLLDAMTRAQMARSLAFRGEALFLIRDRLIPATEWDLRTRDGVPTAYRLSIPEAGGGYSTTALAEEVLHVRIGADPAQPWIGQAPLKRASITASMLNAVESALAETFETAPLGSQIVHLPDSQPDDMANMRREFRGKRGSVLVVEGAAQSAAAGLHPGIGQKPDDLSPNLKDSMAVESLKVAREAISFSYGVIPAMLNSAATGPIIREAQRHLAQWTLAPIARLIEQEAGEKLGGAVSLDVMRPLQAFDTGGRARALSAIVRAQAEAAELGVDIDPALRLIGWE